MRNSLTILLLLSIFSSSKLVAQTTTYLWSNGATTSTIDVNPNVTTTYRVTITHTGVPYYYSLVVAESKCESTDCKHCIFSLFCNKPFDFLEF
ncbi:MAG: hypothetical protein RL264_318 [Bacteroidota bacterium]|jgi:hypothetical protein